MLLQKGCPRCNGPMLAEHDHHGEYESCLACGYVREPELAQVQALVRQESGRKRGAQPHHQVGTGRVA